MRNPLSRIHRQIFLEIEMFKEFCCCCFGPVVAFSVVVVDDSG